MTEKSSMNNKDLLDLRWNGKLPENYGQIFNEIVGASPENPGIPPGAVLTIAQRTRDVSSNEVVVFDISNLYINHMVFH